MNISLENFEFLKKLRENNNREWFTRNKETFKEHETATKQFFTALQESLSKTDHIEGYHLFRIYRDVRFSKDKTPFKARFAGSFKRATAELRGGYFINLEPGNSIVGGGFYAPNPADLKRIRQEFEESDTEIRAILSDKQLISTFGELRGTEVKTAPRGFDFNHAAIDLIKKKQFYFFREFTDQEVSHPDFKKEVIKTFKVLRPYFDYMSAVLTSNMNGESIL